MVYSYKNLWDYFGMGLNQVFIFMGKWQILGLLHYYGFQLDSYEMFYLRVITGLLQFQKEL